MANALLEGKYYKKAIVDTAPAAGGYSTSEVPESVVRGFDDKKLTFSVSTGVGDVTLKYLGAGETDTWQDEAGSPYTAGDAKQVNTTAHDRRWKATCEEGAYTSGDLIFGFEW